MIDYSAYKLNDRELVFCTQPENKDLPQPNYCITWEDPDEVDGVVKITTPSPQWLSMAMHGGILPPVEVYWALRHDESQPGFTRHTRGSLLHDSPPMRAMTEEEAMEYLVMKEIPMKVWCGYKGNRQILRIVPRSCIPTDRSYRNAWTIHQSHFEEAA